MLVNLLERIDRPARAIWLFLLLAVATASLVSLSPGPAAAADPNAYVTANVNLRAGPDTEYPAIVIIPAGEYVTIYACIEDLSWCDVSYGDSNRGWVSAQYVQPFYQGRYMSVQEYVPLVNLPTQPFDIRLYWSSFYSGQPFYGELDQWAAPRPAFRTTSFYEPLGAYGDWVEVQDQYVWVPRNVDGSWRPYTHGHWAETDQYGWFWVSDEPFGWATYHYGRWGFSHDIGWFWVPGTVWAPAWVAWRGSDDYLGWAPLPPSPDDGLSISINIGTVPDYYWQVVPAQSFLSVDLSVAIIHDQGVFGAAFGRTRPLGNVTIVNNVVVNKVVNVTFVEQKTQKKVIVEKVAGAGALEAGGKNTLGKIGVFTPGPGGTGGPPKHLRKIEEVSLLSKTKGQAGNEKALDLVTQSKLKGPAPGKKLKTGEAPPPPPPPGGGTQNGVKLGGQGCPAGEEKRGDKCVPIKCPAGHQLRGNECVCPEGMRDNADHVCVKAPGAGPACNKGHVAEGDKCVCPPGTRDNADGVCAKPAAGPACVKGHVAEGDKCVCPPGTRENSDGVCAKPPAGPACVKGHVAQGDRCVCPPGTRENADGVCAKPPAGPNCVKGHIAQGDRCVCPPGMRDNPDGACVKPPAAPVCTGGHVAQGDHCVCPPGLQDGPNGSCVPKAGPGGPKPPAGQPVAGPKQCPAGEQLRGNECVPVCPAGQHLGPDNRCHK